MSTLFHMPTIEQTRTTLFYLIPLLWRKLWLDTTIEKALELHWHQISLSMFSWSYSLSSMCEEASQFSWQQVVTKNQESLLCLLLLPLPGSSSLRRTWNWNQEQATKKVKASSQTDIRFLRKKGWNAACMLDYARRRQRGSRNANKEISMPKLGFILDQK